MSRFANECMRASYDRNHDELRRLLEGIEVRAMTDQRRIQTLPDVLLHLVRPEHQQHLRAVIEAHFAGKPIPLFNAVEEPPVLPGGVS